MNMVAPRRDADEEHCATAPAAKLWHLEFNEVRAGRLVAESIQGYFAIAGMQVARALIVGLEVVEGLREGHVRRRHLVHVRPLRVERGAARLLLERRSADTLLVSSDDEEDEGLVRWFAEQYAVAEGAAGVPPTDAGDEPEIEGDVMLTLSSAPRLTQSWRGGGTMRQR